MNKSIVMKVLAVIGALCLAGWVIRLIGFWAVLIAVIALGYIFRAQLKAFVDKYAK